MSEEYISGEENKARHEKSSASRRGHKVEVPLRSLWLVAAIIILCGLSFWGGRAYQKHHAPAATKTTTANGSGFDGGGGQRRSGGAIGQVTAVSSTSITVNNERSGASQTFSITSSTTISDSGQTVPASDIQTGDTVLIVPTTSGGTTAGRILVNPSFGGGGGFGGSSSGSATSGSATE